MPHDHDQDDIDLNPSQSQRLRQDLQALYTPTIDVAADADRAIFDMATRHFAVIRRRRMILRRVAATLGAAASAAAILLVVWVGHTWHEASPASPKNVPVKVATIQNDPTAHRRPDIRDAFRLARDLESGRQPQPRWDLNRDGKVDRADVDAIAMAAVKLDERVVQ
ncbi:MAG: hypothetical protein JXQ73_21690 [Phycisphaerae bacterium]|nr:hypothetical protein [Phycisphaerae bacterium]